MSILFALLRFFGYECGIYDKVIFLVLLDLDIIATFTIARWWKIWH